MGTVDRRTTMYHADLVQVFVYLPFLELPAIVHEKGFSLHEGRIMLSFGLSRMVKAFASQRDTYSIYQVKWSST